VRHFVKFPPHHLIPDSTWYAESTRFAVFGVILTLPSASKTTGESPDLVVQDLPDRESIKRFVWDLFCHFETTGGLTCFVLILLRRVGINIKQSDDA